MADTGIVGPLSNSTLGTALADGNTYATFSNPQRIYRTATGAGASTTTTALKGNLWFNCFDSGQIPTGATITGVEIVAGVDFDGSGNSNFGTFGSTGIYYI